MAKGFALIRSTFGVDPALLSDVEFSKLLGEAVWLKGWEMDLMEGVFTKALARVFGGKKGAK